MHSPDHFPQPTDPANLERRLREAGLPVDSWGEGPTKTVEDLWCEIIDGESQLVVSAVDEQHVRRGELVRVTNVLGLDVYVVNDGKLYRLKEDRQEFNNGRGVRRRQIDTSLAEKIKADEDHVTAAIRAVQEELGVSGVESIERLGEREVLTMTKTFPGMPTRLRLFSYRVFIAPADFRPEGYIERQADKQTFFVWEQLTTD